MQLQNLHLPRLWSGPKTLILTRPAAVVVFLSNCSYDVSLFEQSCTHKQGPGEGYHHTAIVTGISLVSVWNFVSIMKISSCFGSLYSETIFWLIVGLLSALRSCLYYAVMSFVTSLPYSDCREWRSMRIVQCIVVDIRFCLLYLCKEGARNCQFKLLQVMWGFKSVYKKRELKMVTFRWHIRVACKHCTSKFCWWKWHAVFWMLSFRPSSVRGLFLCIL